MYLDILFLLRMKWSFKKNAYLFWMRWTFLKNAYTLNTMNIQKMLILWMQWAFKKWLYSKCNGHSKYICWGFNLNDFVFAISERLFTESVRKGMMANQSNIRWHRANRHKYSLARTTFTPCYRCTGTDMNAHQRGRNTCTI